MLRAVCLPAISLPAGCGGGLRDLSSLLEVRLFGAGLCLAVLSPMPLGCWWQSDLRALLFRNGLLVCQPTDCFIFLIQGLFTFPKIHPFKVYNSVTFSVFTSLCSHHQLQNICHPTKKPWLHLKTAPLSPQPQSPEPVRPCSVSFLALPVASLPRAARAVPSCYLSPPSSFLLHLCGYRPFLFIDWARIWCHVEMENMDFAEPTWVQVLELTFINLVTWASPGTLPCGRGFGELPFPPSCTEHGCSTLEYVSLVCWTGRCLSCHPAVLCPSEEKLGSTCCA